MSRPSPLLPTATAVCALLTPVLPAAAGTLLIANKSDHTVDLVRTADRSPVATLPTGRFPHEVVISPDGRTAVISNYGDRAEPGSSLSVYDLAPPSPRSVIDLGRHTRPHGLAWIAGERLAVTAEGSGHLLVVDVATGQVVREMETGQSVSHMVAVEPVSGRAFVANIGSGTVSVFDLEAGTKLADVDTGAGAEGIALRPGTREIWVGNRAADTLSVLDADRLEILHQLPCPGFPIRIAFTPDGRRALVSAARAGELVAFDAADRREVARRKLDFDTVPEATSRLFGDRFGDSPVPVGLVISTDGATAWVAATQADVVAVVDTTSLEVRELIRAGREPDGMALVGE